MTFRTGATGQISERGSMRIIDGLSLEGRPAEIPDCSRDDLPAFFVEMGYKVGAEIGVYKGEFTKQLCEAGLKVYGIDPWGNSRSEKRYPEYRSRQDFLFEHTQRTLAPYLKSGQCELIRQCSMEAVRHFKNETLDFIYIDADHRFRFIAEDLYEWPWRVRSGGVVSGHDYFHTVVRATRTICHVGPVVDAYTRCYLKGSWYLLGRMKHVPGEQRDKWLSWMWVKP